MDFQIVHGCYIATYDDVTKIFAQIFGGIENLSYLCRREVNASNCLLNNTSAGTVDYTGGEGVRAFLSESHSSVKPEAHLPEACG